MPKAAILTGLEQPLEIHDVELESPHAGEVRVRMGASGVCHSDLSVQNGTLMGMPPIVLGHEGAGIIEEVGEGVTDLKPGDHVVISWVPQCGECFYCERDQGHLCKAADASLATGGDDCDRRAQRHQHESDGANRVLLLHGFTCSTS